MSKKSRRQARSQKQVPKLPSQAAIIRPNPEKQTIGQQVNNQVLSRLRMLGVNPDSPTPSILPTPVPRTNGVEKINVKLPDVPPLPTNGAVVSPQVEEKLLSHWPECPQYYDRNEWTQSLKNRDYYDEQQLIDDCALSWFSYPRQALQYSEFVFTTPDMAQKVLDAMPLNRNEIQDHSDAISRDMANGRFIQTDDSISLNKLSNFHDGQHREQAIIKAAKLDPNFKGWPLYYTWNVPVEAIYTKDSGKNRTTYHRLQILSPDLKLTQKHMAVCRAMMMGMTARQMTYTDSEVGEFFVRHKDVISWLGKFKCLNKQRADLQAVMGKSLLWWGLDVVEPFLQRLQSMQFTGDGDPAKTLFVWLNKQKEQGKRRAFVAPVIYYKKSLAAIYAHATGKPCVKVTQKKDDIFEWLAGWEVPPNAPAIVAASKE